MTRFVLIKHLALFSINFYQLEKYFSETKYIFVHLFHDGGGGGGGVGHAEAVAEAPGGHGDRGQHLDRDTWARGHVARGQHRTRHHAVICGHTSRN